VGLKVNANKSHFTVSEIEYLGYWITRNGIQPVPKKVKAIQCIAPLTTCTRKQANNTRGTLTFTSHTLTFYFPYSNHTFTHAS
jgi:hypothetical protein